MQACTKFIYLFIQLTDENMQHWMMHNYYVKKKNTYNKQA